MLEQREKQVVAGTLLDIFHDDGAALFEGVEEGAVELRGRNHQRAGHLRPGIDQMRLARARRPPQDHGE